MYHFILTDETFLRKRKYDRGTERDSHSITILGMYCGQQKRGLFFKVQSKGREHLYPLIHKYIEPDTSLLCTDQGKQYANLKDMFPESTHLTVNHSKGEFVSKSNPENHINSQEGQNKWLKNTVKYHTDDDSLLQYICWYEYQQHCLSDCHSLGERVNTFLKDVAKCFPGPGSEPLKYLAPELPTPVSEEIEHLMPKVWQMIHQDQ